MENISKFISNFVFYDPNGTGAQTMTNIYINLRGFLIFLDKANVIRAHSQVLTLRYYFGIFFHYTKHDNIWFCKRWAVRQMVPLCSDRLTISANVYLTACLFITSKCSSIPNTFYLRVAELIIILPWEHFCAANTSQTTFHLFPEWQEGFYCLRDG